jgi:SH3-like domain-containing protein
MRTFRVLILLATVAGLGLGALQGVALAQSSEATGSIPEQQLGASGLPLPRFVSLKGSSVNARVGPGLNYGIEWRYLKSGIPMEIIQEFDNWRRVRDSDGSEAWINQALLSGRRTAVVAPWHRGAERTMSLHASPDQNARVVAHLEPGVVGGLRLCNGIWCEMEVANVRGWIRQTELWGAYPGETYKD